MRKKCYGILDQGIAFKNFLLQKNFSVFIDTTSGCNLRCTFCSRKTTKLVQMTTEEFKTIISKIHKRICTFQLSCAWEYSIATNASEIIRELGKYHLPSTTIYSNGNILTDDIAHAVIEARLNYFVVSIGEAKKETYERLRKGGNFERVLTNIKKLSQLKKKHNTKLPHICTNLTILNSNIDELIDFIDLAHSIGVERIIGRHLILNKCLDINNEIVKDKGHINNIIENAEKKSLDYGMSFSIPKFGDHLVPKSCRAPWQKLYIASNGDVSVCPRIHLYAKVGNLLIDNFSSILKSNEMKELKNQFDTLEFSNPVCGVCIQNRETEIAIDQGF